MNPVPFAKEGVDRGFERNREYLVGKWLGEAPLQGGGRRVWLNHRFADGTYVVTFVAYRDGKPVSEQSEFGDWGLSGDIYFTIMRGYGSEVPHLIERETRGSYEDDAYRVTKLTDKEFHYTSVATGRSYVTHKVSDDYLLEKKPIQIIIAQRASRVAD